MHPGSRLTTRQFIANSLLLCLFKTLFYSGFTGWGTPFYTQIYGALGGHPSAFHIGNLFYSYKMVSGTTPPPFGSIDHISIHPMLAEGNCPALVATSR